MVFCGTLTASGLELGYEGGKMKITKEGKVKKLVKKVEQITFSGEYESTTGQKSFMLRNRTFSNLCRKASC